MTPTQIAYLFGGGVALFILLLVIGGNVYSYFRAGRETLQRRHQKAVKQDVKLLKASQPVCYDGASLRADLEYLCTGLRPASRVERWQYRLQQRPDIVVKGCPGEDAAGARYYLASIGGQKLAHRDLDALIDDAETVADAKLHAQDVPATLSEYYYDELRAGRVDYSDLERSVRGDCLTRLKSNLRQNGEVDQEDLWERFVYDFRYPPGVVLEKIEQLDGRDARTTKENTIVWQRY